MITRRRVLALAAAAACVRAAPAALASSAGILTRNIPSSGEALPVIGMGSSRTFDVILDDASRTNLGQVLAAFFELGGTVIDTSPMYGNAEHVLGELLHKTPGHERLFAATKVWTNGRHAGEQQMRQSMQRMKVARFDLIQIHNLRDWRVHLETLNRWKADGAIRYTGITTSHGRFHNDLVKLLAEHAFDFLQLSYSIGNRDVERRLLPIAAERGIAVIANRPFERGSLFQRVRGTSPPPWAVELGMASWGQFFLKFVVSHPQVTCTIPATSKVTHMRDNMGALRGPLPDAATRRRMAAFMDTL